MPIHIRTNILQNFHDHKVYMQFTCICILYTKMHRKLLDYKGKSVSCIMQANSGGREKFSMSQGFVCFENNFNCRVFV